MIDIPGKVANNFCFELYDKIISSHGTTKRLFDGQDIRILYFEGPNSTERVGYCCFDPDSPMEVTVNTVHAIAMSAKHVSAETLIQMKQDESLMYVLVYNYRKAAMAAFYNENDEFSDTMRLVLANSVNELSKKGIILSAKDGGMVTTDISGRKEVKMFNEMEERRKQRIRTLRSSDVISVQQTIDLNEQLTALNKRTYDRIFAETIANGIDSASNQQQKETGSVTRMYVNTSVLDEIIAGRNSRKKPR